MVRVIVDLWFVWVLVSLAVVTKNKMEFRVVRRVADVVRGMKGPAKCGDVQMGIIGTKAKWV